MNKDTEHVMSQTLCIDAAQTNTAVTTSYFTASNQSRTEQQQYSWRKRTWRHSGVLQASPSLIKKNKKQKHDINAD